MRLRLHRKKEGDYKSEKIEPGGSKKNGRKKKKSIRKEHHLPL